MDARKMALEIEAIVTTGRRYEGQYRGKPEVFREFFQRFGVADEGTSDFLAGFLLGFFDCAKDIEQGLIAGRQRLLIEAEASVGREASRA
jgi:hypothetical protein